MVPNGDILASVINAAFTEVLMEVVIGRNFQMV